MSDDAERWREKYLKSIEQQEKLERRWAARLDLLRRGLVRSTLAAEGTDRAVDQCMKEMREVVRTDDMDAGLAALLPRLEKAVLDSEQRRETRVEQTSAALTALVAQLQSLPLPKDVSRPLKKFAKQLEDRAGQAREIPLLLSELSGLQGKALSALDAPVEPSRPGLLQRLFGGQGHEDATPQPHDPAQASVAPASEMALPVAVAPATAAESVAPAPAPAPAPQPSVAEQAPALETTPEPVALTAPQIEIAPVPAPAPAAEVVQPASESDDQATEPAPLPTPLAEVPPVVAPALENPDELMPEEPAQALPAPSLPPAELDEPLEGADVADAQYALPDSPEPS